MYCINGRRAGPGGFGQALAHSQDDRLFNSLVKQQPLYYQIISKCRSPTIGSGPNILSVLLLLKETQPNEINPLPRFSFVNPS